MTSAEKQSAEKEIGISMPFISSYSSIDIAKYKKYLCLIKKNFYQEDKNND